MIAIETVTIFIEIIHIIYSRALIIVKNVLKNVTMLMTLLVVACGSNSTPTDSQTGQQGQDPGQGQDPSSDRQVDEYESLPVDTIYDAIWQWNSYQLPQQPPVVVLTDAVFSLQYGPPYPNPLGVNGYTKCRRYVGKHNNQYRLIELTFNNIDCTDEALLDGGLELIFESALLSIVSHNISNNELEIITKNGTRLIFKPGFDSRMERFPAQLLVENTQKIRFEDTAIIRSEDSAVLHSAFEIVPELLSTDVIQFINAMKSTPIYTTRICRQEELFPSTQETRFFTINVTNLDEESFFYGAGNVCGTNQLGSRRFKKEDIFTLQSMVEL